MYGLKLEGLLRVSYDEMLRGLLPYHNSEVLDRANA